MNFKETVQAMSAKDIILTMVEGIRNSWCGKEIVNIPRNFICEIFKENIFEEYIGLGVFGTHEKDGVLDVVHRKGGVFDNQANPKIQKASFIEYFERGINALRAGDVGRYNDIAEAIGIAKIKKEFPKGVKPEYLGNEIEEYQLRIWEKIAYFQV